MKLVDPTLSAIAEKCARTSNVDLDPWTLRRNPLGGFDSLRHHLEGPGSDEDDNDDDEEDHDDDGEDDHIREMLMRIGDDGDSHIRELLRGMMQERGGRRESRHSTGARGGFVSALWGGSDRQQHDASAGQQRGASVDRSLSFSPQETFEPLVTSLRELLLPFATSAVDLKGIEQVDRISEALLGAVIVEPSSASPSAETAVVTAALSKLKELALRGDLADMLDSPAGLRLVRALCLFMDDAPGSASPINVVCRRALFRSAFSSRDANGASKQAGLHALLQQIIPFFEENHSEVIALFYLESAAASSVQAQSSQSSGSYQIHLKPIPDDSGCRQYFGFTSISYAHDASSDLRSIAGKHCFTDQAIPTCSVLFQASQYCNSQS